MKKIMILLVLLVFVVFVGGCATSVPIAGYTSGGSVTVPQPSLSTKKGEAVAIEVEITPENIGLIQGKWSGYRVVVGGSERTEKATDFEVKSASFGKVVGTFTFYSHPEGIKKMNFETGPIEEGKVWVEKGKNYTYLTLWRNNGDWELRGKAVNPTVSRIDYFFRR